MKQDAYKYEINQRDIRSFSPHDFCSNAITFTQT